MSLLPYYLARRRTLPAPPSRLILPDDALLTYWPVQFSQYNPPNRTQAANGLYIRYHNDNGDYYEVSVPAPPPGYADYTSALFGGYVDGNGAVFAVSQGGAAVGTGTQEAAAAGQGQYFTFENLVRGQPLRITKTGNGSRPAASLLNDYILFS